MSCLEKNKDPFFDANKVKYISKLLQDISDKHKNIPFFIHLHLMETHTIKSIPYENGMIESDKNIKNIYLSLKNNKLLNKTLFIISSDHTQGWKTLKPIPLLIRFPNLEHAGEHIVINTQMIDLPQTILDYIGIQKPAFMEGKSLLYPNRIEQNRPIYSINELNVKNGIVISNTNNYGVSQIKVQVCNDYLLKDLDNNGKITKILSFHGYSSVLACHKTFNHN